MSFYTTSSIPSLYAYSRTTLNCLPYTNQIALVSCTLRAHYSTTQSNLDPPLYLYIIIRLGNRRELWQICKHRWWDSLLSPGYVIHLASPCSTIL